MERASIAAILGGSLWIPYGAFEFLEPWGEGIGPYRPDLGYELVADPLLYTVYGLTGAVALLLAALALLGFSTPRRRLARTGRVLAYVAGLLGALAVVGVLAQVVPLFVAGLVFGSLSLGLAALAVGIEALKDPGPRTWPLLLIATGFLGVLTFPLRPLVYVDALALLPRAAGAAFIAVFGLGWLGLGVMAQAGGSGLSSAGMRSS